MTKVTFLIILSLQNDIFVIKKLTWSLCAAWNFNCAPSRFAGRIDCDNVQAALAIFRAPSYIHRKPPSPQNQIAYGWRTLSSTARLQNTVQAGLKAATLTLKLSQHISVSAIVLSIDLILPNPD